MGLLKKFHVNFLHNYMMIYYDLMTRLKDENVDFINQLIMNKYVKIK